jgi:flagellar motor switch protein FliN
MAQAQTAGIQSQAGPGVKGPSQSPNGQTGRVPPEPGLARQPGQTAPAGGQVAVAQPQERALVPTSAPVETVEIETNAKVFGAQIARLPVELDVSIPVRGFRVRDLLALEPGRLIESEWSSGGDLPLAAGAVQLAWSEFEVIETELVVRLTRLA